LEELAERFGTRPWASYFDPAIRAAEEGVLVTSFMYGLIYARWEDSKRMQDEDTRREYMPEGHLVGVGQRWKRPRLAKDLRKAASEGADYFYTGDWAKRYVKKATKQGAGVTMEDMADYEVRWSDPLHFTYRGYEIFTELAPVFGGVELAYNLNILENFDLKSMGHYTESPDTLEIMARTFGRVWSEVRWLQDPLSFKNPIDLLLSKEYGKMGAEFVRNIMPQPNVDFGSSEHMTALLQGQNSEHLYSGKGFDSLGCNHNTIVDAEGNWITALHGGGGSPGLTYGPGRRMGNPCAATIVAKDGKPWLALGTPGSPHQPVTEVLINIIDFGMHPKEAADAPRFWARSYDHMIRIESRISAKVRKEIQKRGIKIQDLKEYNWHTGSFQIIWRDAKTGKLQGVTDPRRLGYADGF
jgi:gamma-glutamyltranspeptidase/glutathione hydrolase